MTEIKNASGLMVVGSFAKVEDGSFAGTEGQVRRTVLTVHDAVGLSYLTVNAMNDDAARLAAESASYKPGDPVVVRVKVAKSGSLTFVGYVR